MDTDQQSRGGHDALFHQFPAEVRGIGVGGLPKLLEPDEGALQPGFEESDVAARSGVVLGKSARRDNATSAQPFDPPVQGGGRVGNRGRRGFTRDGIGARGISSRRRRKRSDPGGGEERGGLCGERLFSDGQDRKNRQKKGKEAERQPTGMHPGDRWSPALLSNFYSSISKAFCPIKTR